MSRQSIIEVADLQQLLDDPNLRIIDARFSLNDTQAGEREWQNAHIPFAQYLHLDRDLSDHRKASTDGRHPIPDAADFCKNLERIGISPDSKVVVYDQQDSALAAARVWWLLRLLGHQQVAVLNGGFTAWQQAGGKVSGDTNQLDSGNYSASYADDQVVNSQQLEQLLKQQQCCLIDARAAERFRGEIEPLDTKAGHIPGAINRHYVLNLDNGRFKSATQLRAEYAQLLGAVSPTRVILSCGSGVTACHNLLAMEYAGLSGARVYAPSWSGWIADPAHAIAIGNS